MDILEELIKIYLELMVRIDDKPRDNVEYLFREMSKWCMEQEEQRLTPKNNPESSSLERFGGVGQQ